MRPQSSDGVGTEKYTYDLLGRLTQLQKTISGTTYTTGYGYNMASELTQSTYPSGRVVQQSYDAIGRLCEIAPQTSGCGNSSTPYATGFAYNPAFQVTGFNYGNGVTASFGYSNDRLQLTSLSYVKGTQTLLGLNYWYKQDQTNCANGNTGNNGQIQCITDNLDGTRSLNYTYDTLYRLTVAQAGPDASPTWKLGSTYDRYGNRTGQTILAGCVPPQTCPTNSVTADPMTNRLGAPYAYDANGNMTNDGLNTVVYDAENRAVTSTTNGTTSTYTYDGNGLRVKKQVGSATATVYIFSGTKVIAEYASGAAVGSPTKEYIHSESRLLATIAGSTTAYHHADHLSVRLTTDTSGNSLGQQGHYPFGEQWYPGPPQAPATKWQFTSYEREGGTNESGNDYAMFRYYVNRVGRFSSPDPLSDSATNPQSWNRYSYVRNDPINWTDPSGLFIAPEVYSLFRGPGGMITGLGSIGFPMGCTIDGLDAPCGMALRFLRSGVGTECPHNDCFGFRALQDGTIQRQLPVWGWSVTPITACIDGTCLPGLQGDWRIVDWQWQTIGRVGTFDDWNIYEAGIPNLRSALPELILAAEELYPKLAGKINLHHIIPKYLGGAANGPTVALPAAYHQQITNAFRALAPYGAAVKPTAEAIAEIIKKVYSSFPLP